MNASMTSLGTFLIPQCRSRQWWIRRWIFLKIGSIQFCFGFSIIMHYLHLLNIRHPLISFDILMIWSCGRFCCELSVIVLARLADAVRPADNGFKRQNNEDLRPVWNDMVSGFFWVSVGLTVYPSYIHTSCGNCTRSKLELWQFWTSHSLLPTTWQTSQFRPVLGTISTRL